MSKPTICCNQFDGALRVDEIIYDAGKPFPFKSLQLCKDAAGNIDYARFNDEEFYVQIEKCPFCEMRLPVRISGVLWIKLKKLKEKT